MSTLKEWRFGKGVNSALASALFLGFTPVFGRQAILLGFSPLLVVALRTFFAAALLLLITLFFKRKFFYIFPLGLIGCLLAGAINGLGSLLYYMALGHLSASVGQLLYSLYPLFVAIWLTLDHQPPSKLTMLRISLAGLAVFLLTFSEFSRADIAGVLLMLGAAALYALHIPINQRVLYEIPAPTVTLYTLISMSAVVVPAYFIFDRSLPPVDAIWWPVAGLTLVTFFSRITLFLGVKHLGGMQTAILGLAELFVSLGLSFILLGERMTPYQWIGASILAIILLLVRFEPSRDKKIAGKGGWLSWLRSPDVAQIPWSIIDRS